VRRDRDKIKDFVNRIWPTPPEQEVEAAGERVLNRLRMELAEHDTSFRSLYGDGWNAEPVNRREFQILTAIAISGDKPTPRTVCDTIESWGVVINFGSLLVALVRLEDRGLIEPGWNEPEKGRGYCALTGAGARSLARARAEGKPLVAAQEDSAKGPCTERIR
jgi:DNA-binding PadR family transcriptional regulator